MVYQLVFDGGMVLVVKALRYDGPDPLAIAMTLDGKEVFINMDKVLFWIITTEDDLKKSIVVPKFDTGKIKLN